jgi:endonuclease-3
MQKKDLPFLASELNKLFPEAKTELHYHNKFQLLIAILLSAQTTDKQVNKATEKLFKILKTPEDGVAL